MFGRAEDQFDMFTYLALYIVTTTAAQQKSNKHIYVALIRGSLTECVYLTALSCRVYVSSLAAFDLYMF